MSARVLFEKLDFFLLHCPSSERFFINTPRMAIDVSIAVLRLVFICVYRKIIIIRHKQISLPVAAVAASCPPFGDCIQINIVTLHMVISFVAIRRLKESKSIMVAGRSWHRQLLISN